MPYYHVTFERHLPSIRKYGLGGKVVEQNWEGCEPGVYLAVNPEDALLMFIERLLFDGPNDLIPRVWVASLRIILVDDSRVDPRKLADDESFPGNHLIRRYTGVIDVTGMPVLTIDDITPPEFQPGGVKHAEILRRLRDSA